MGGIVLRKRDATSHDDVFFCHQLIISSKKPAHDLVLDGQSYALR